MDILNVMAVVALIVSSMWTVISWYGWKSNRTLYDEYQKSFEQVLANLSSGNHCSQLSAAILLRRFFSLKNMKKNNDFLKVETINVISSLLRTLPSGIYQKTVADGLAYAGDLSNVDLQKTNLQDIYLEGKTCQLMMKYCDLYMADLSHALIKNVDAEGAYFLSSLLLKARIKNTNLRFADFRNSDLTSCKFEEVDLYMANFTGAINIPKEISSNLSDYKEEDGTISKRYLKTELVTTNLGKTRGNIYFSIPGCASTEDNVLIYDFRKLIESKGYEVVCYTRDKYPQFGQLNKIRLDIMRSSAMVVFGLKQLRIDKATYRPGTKEEDVWDKKWINTPWNELEVGLGAMKGLPILLVKDDEIENGIFDKNLSESYIATVSTSDSLDKIVNSDPFRTWEEKIGTIECNILSDNHELLLYIAEKQHEKWCIGMKNEGWTYGELLNVELKKHPSLKEFSELPEQEKGVALDSSLGLLKIIDSFICKEKLLL